MYCPLLCESVNVEINRTIKKVNNSETKGVGGGKRGWKAGHHGCVTSVDVTLSSGRESRESLRLQRKQGRAPLFNALPFVLKFAPNYCD